MQIHAGKLPQSATPQQSHPSPPSLPPNFSQGIRSRPNSHYNFSCGGEAGRVLLEGGQAGEGGESRLPSFHSAVRRVKHFGPRTVGGVRVWGKRDSAFGEGPSVWSALRCEDLREVQVGGGEEEEEGESVDLNPQPTRPPEHN